MDGSNRQVIVRDKLLEPVAITLDSVKQRVYWLDRKYDHLETCDYFGSRRYILTSGSRNLPHSVSLDIFESVLFYADTTKLAIMRFLRHTITTEANITYHSKLSQMPRHVKVWHRTKQLKGNRSNPCQINNAGCAHFCLLGTSTQSANTFRCKCKLGYELKRDLKSCERVKESLYVAQMRTMRGISLDPSMNTETRPPLLAERIGAIRAIDNDCKNNITFFFDPVRKAIFQSKYSADDSNEMSTSPQLLVPNDLTYSVESLAWDWIGKNLFFSNGPAISVVSYLNPRFRRELIREQSQIYALTVDPNAGFMFYSTLNRPAKIFRAYMDGKNVSVLQQRGLARPTSISLDYALRRVYWVDAQLSKIQYCDYNGTNVVTLTSVGISMPVSVVVFKFSLFVYDARLATIFKTSKYFANSPSILRANLNSVFQMKMMALDLQTVIDNHPCSRQNGDCSHFCFAVPSTSSQYQLLRHCGIY